MSSQIEPLKGEELFNAPPETVYNALTDLALLSKNIPNLDSSEIVDDKTLKCLVRPGFSFIRGTMRLTVRLADANPPKHAELRVTANGIGMGMEIEAKLDISPEQGGKASKLQWQTRVISRTGLLSLISPSLIQGAAEKTIREGWNSLRKQVEA